MRKWLVISGLVLAVVYSLPYIGSRFLGWGPDQRVLPARGELIDIGDGRELNVHDEGEGRPIVLIHGWASNSADWDDVPALLAKRGHRVISYDRAGYGYSTRFRSSEGNFSTESNARDLLALLDTLGIADATLVGWSFGGGVAQQVAVEHPNRVTHVVLIGSSGPRTNMDEGSLSGPLESLLGSPLAVPILDWISKVPPISYKLTHDNIALAFSGERNIPTGWTIYTQAMLALPDTSAAVAGEAQSEYSDPDLSQIRVPTLVIHGTDDNLAPYTTGEALHRLIPNSALEAIIGGSHMLPVTHAEDITTNIDKLVGTQYRQGTLPSDDP
jgi:pimeloyl-ACP methyl ester carboxylesterase